MLLFVMYSVKAASSLVHKNRVEIDGLREDTLFHIVFTVVYEIGLPDVSISDDAQAKRVCLHQLLVYVMNVD